MIKKIIVRRFKNEDIDELYNLIQSSLYTNLILKVYDKRAMDIWHSCYTKKYILSCDKTKHLYVALYNNHVVASGAINIENGMSYLSTIYTDTKMQGKGIGKQIILALEKDEYALQTKKIFLHASLSANIFYQKMGYHYKNDIPEIVTDAGVDFIYLEKEI